MVYTISSIDWNELAHRYNVKTKQDVSFEGSSIQFSYLKEYSLPLVISLCVKSHSETKTIETEVQLQRDPSSGKLSYVECKTDKIQPLNPNTLIIDRRFILFNIISDYIEPFILSHSFPILIVGLTRSLHSLKIPCHTISSSTK
jgi:hypothetical protein